MTQRLLPLALTILALPAFLAVAAAEENAIAYRGSIDFKGSDEELAAFSWSGTPGKLSQGIMFETIVQRPAGDNEFVAAVAPASCAAWQDEITAGAGPMEIAFYDRGNKLLGVGRGSANVVAADCDGTPKTIAVRVPASFNIGMPPS